MGRSSAQHRTGPHLATLPDSALYLLALVFVDAKHRTDRHAAGAFVVVPGSRRQFLGINADAELLYRFSGILGICGCARDAVKFLPAGFDQDPVEHVVMLLKSEQVWRACVTAPFCLLLGVSIRVWGERITVNVNTVRRVIADKRANHLAAKKAIASSRMQGFLKVDNDLDGIAPTGAGKEDGGRHEG